MDLETTIVKADLSTQQLPSQAISQLMNELEQGRQSGEQYGWLTLNIVEENIGLVCE